MYSPAEYIYIIIFSGYSETLYFTINVSRMEVVEVTFLRRASHVLFTPVPLIFCP
jgi:hypothetical protein